MQQTRVAFLWSGGKDSALALSRLLASDAVVVDRLVVAVAATDERSIVHEIPVDLLRSQARAIGIPVVTVPVPGDGLEGYVDAMRTTGARLRELGVDAVGFGDLSRSGARVRRQETFAPVGLDVVEPLWGLTSRESVDLFLRSGLRAVTVVVDADVLGPAHVGVPLDSGFVAALPPGADPAGELGEYHTFVHAGPIFAGPVPFALDPLRHWTRLIGTTQGPRQFAYWGRRPVSPDVE